jgi:hypothetical protein
MVLVIGLGLALAGLGRYLVSLGRPSSVSFGWFAYAPLNSTTAAAVRHVGLRPWARLLIWLALIAVWTLASVRILRPPATGQPE